MEQPRILPIKLLPLTTYGTSVKYVRRTEAGILHVFRQWAKLPDQGAIVICQGNNLQFSYSTLHT